MTWIVNNRSRLLPLAYRPATLGLLVVLWAMALAAVMTGGLRLPAFDADALAAADLRRATFVSFASLLGLLTGAGVFASMELAFEGLEPQRSRKALLSLLMVAATSLVFLLLAGPAIVAQVDPADTSSVIYQGITGLLPGPLGVAAVAVGVLALLVVTASAMLAMQSLVLGLRDRRYAPGVSGPAQPLQRRQPAGAYPGRAGRRLFPIARFTACHLFADLRGRHAVPVSYRKARPRCAARCDPAEIDAASVHRYCWPCSRLR